MSWGNPELPAVVLLHGFLGNGQDWQPVAKNLCQQFFCLAPNYTQSEHSSFEQIAKQLDHWLQSQGLTASPGSTGSTGREFAMVGYSLGGRVAMYHACRGQQTPAALFIESAHPGLLTAHDKQARLAHDARWAGKFANDPLVDVLGEWYRQPVFSDLTPEQRQAAVNSRLGQSGRQLANTLLGLSLGKQPELHGELGQLKIPLAFCSGEQDPKFSALGDELSRLIPTLHRKTLPDAGHNCHQQSPKRFVACLEAFLAGAAL